ncbi:putative metal-dependent hydrolase [Peribacillus frigoritolerans]|uniref:DUF309 domain-containing protein n=1 Tax=Peribacillus frigoritolerans TaxID=450367 RepID=UPI000BBA1E1F|nr:DUF309 domain-containing protein [Peribacillus frigoritolerans]MCP1494263.1 putative metal-dependent hydrolase [Peribacillus frigoritolerans]PCD09164.1 hypothetical protein CMV16_01745 [Peribacillus simplex]
MTYAEDYLSFLVHFHGTRDYFECHEILEEYWKETAPKERDSHWVGLIQIAVALYHDRRGNKKGAARTLAKALANLHLKKAELLKLGLDPERLFKLLEDTLERMLSQKPYKSINLPISDQRLIEKCQSMCSQEGSIWGADSDMTNTSIVDKHLMRDRSDVISERARQLSLRKTRMEDRP